MHSKSFKSLLILAIFIIVVSNACGAVNKPTTEVVASPTVQEKPTEPPPPTDTPVPAGLVTSLSDLKKATIQIESVGTFIDPQFGYIANAAGRGSGFIIDPSGIAITNNHVVTGAAMLKVWVGGDTTREYNARILGVSECSDLAVIDIEGDGFPYLAWYDKPTAVGLEVYLAGYPLGDPEYTMTKGIVSKEKADGETFWASVDSVIEHTATGNPGNSGGPLVDASGKVVGVHYASYKEATQYFAIDHSIATKVIDQLKTGKDVDSIGINGQAVSNEDGSLTGIWVSSVKSGSSADKAGVKAGDIITKMENLYLATDYTMKDYCDILRTKPGETMALQVLRWSTQEVLEGQLNGRTLEVAYTFGGEEPTEEPGTEPTPTGVATNLPANCEASETTGYMTCWDDTNKISLDIPDTWTDINGTPWYYNNEEIGVAISAAPSLSDFENYWDAEGIFFGASDTFAQIGGYIEFLDYYNDAYESDCHLVGRYDYNDGIYRGKFDYYNKCGGTSGYDAYVLSAVDIEDQFSKIILIEMMVYPNDTTTRDHIWNTFWVYF